MRFEKVLRFDKHIRRIPVTLRILIVAVIAAIFSLKGFHTGGILASAGILTMPMKKPVKRSAQRQLISKARKVIKRRPEQLSDIDLDFLSVLIDGVDPANGAPVIVKSADGKEVELKMHLVQKDVKQGLLYATNYEPDKVDKQNQTATAQEIQKMAHALLKKGVNIDVNHNLKKSDSSLVESFILRGEDPMFPNISKGSHCVVIQLSDDLKAKAESITGISMYGHAVVQKEDPASGANNDPDPVDPDGDGKALQGLRASAGIGDVQMAAALGLDHQKYLDFENGAADYEWSADSIKSAAKLLKMPVEEFTSSLLNGSLGDEPAEADPPATDPAEPAPAGPAQKSVKSTQSKTTMIPEPRRVLKATEPSPIKITGEGTQIIQVKKSLADQQRIVGKAALFASKQILIAKGYLTEEQFETKEQLISKGLFAPGDFDPSGSIQPALAREVFDVTVDRSGFLKRIQTVMMTSIMQNVAVADIGERTMTRITVAGSPGATVASGTQAKTVNLAKQLHAYVVDLPFFIGFDLVYNYQGNLPALEQKIGEIIMLSYGNQHVDLGFNGTTNTYASTFLSLSEGWLALAIRVIAASTDGANTAQNVSISGDVTLTTPAKIMDKMIAVMTQYQARYANNPQNAFIISPADFQTFETGLIGRPNADQTLVDGARYKYRGHEIIVVDYLGTGNYMYTPLSNFIYAMVTQGQGGTRLQSLEVLGGIQHNLSSAVDFDFVNYQPLVIAQP